MLAGCQKWRMVTVCADTNHESIGIYVDAVSHAGSTKTVNRMQRFISQGRAWTFHRVF